MAKHQDKWYKYANSDVWIKRPVQLTSCLDGSRVGDISVATNPTNFKSGACDSGPHDDPAAIMFISQFILPSITLFCKEADTKPMTSQAHFECTYTYTTGYSYRSCSSALYKLNLLTKQEGKWLGQAVFETSNLRFGVKNPWCLPTNICNVQYHHCELGQHMKYFPGRHGSDEPLLSTKQSGNGSEKHFRGLEKPLTSKRTFNRHIYSSFYHAEYWSWRKD